MKTFVIVWLIGIILTDILMILGVHRSFRLSNKSHTLRDCFKESLYFGILPSIFLWVWFLYLIVFSKPEDIEGSAKAKFVDVINEAAYLWD